MNSSLQRFITDNGVKSKNTHTIIGGADHNLFYDMNFSKKELIGFSTAYYNRKSPDKILDVIKNMPNENFLLLGKGWEKYIRYDELITLPNFTYKDINYVEYPSYYNKMKVFVSLSKIEGGPIPLIETMMCNVVPVVTNTGFADDVIQDGINGYILPVNATTELIIETISKALTHNSNISESVRNFTWDKFSQNIFNKIG
jgi:glycosyltransferase involved in cell wall biosynthesis